jgi:ferritin-like metal-binding protein YciE
MTNLTLDGLFLAELQETYAAETLIASTLSMFAGTADSRSGEYLALTRYRIQRLEQMFSWLGRDPEPGRPTTLQGFLSGMEVPSGGNGAASEDAAAIISAMQTARHYLLARYGTLALWANELHMPDIAKLAATILEEEKARPDARPTAHDSAKHISLGERLTAMFDRKR